MVSLTKVEELYEKGSAFIQSFTALLLSVWSSLLQGHACPSHVEQCVGLCRAL